ncbi:hypothetical protein [Kitasatospora sp. NPDC059827]|uniref:hypothetical protein n=1 Tax=Kitasatospora sp. NPDC059827 TaxID=3346964 RepID=UPI00365C2780
MTEEPQLGMPLEALGAVGAKSLRLFQLVRIGRHPSTVIPVGRADVTLLTGTGPEGGSNGVGKSMMASAIALANADADWLRGGIGHHARNLLFNHNAAETNQVSDAPHGFIISVYWKDGEPRTTAVTVWMRIQRTDPFVQVKFAPGIHLAAGPTEQDCATHATEVWNSLAGPALTSGKYAEALFGNGTRCLAYLRKRGEKSIDDGILASAGQPHKPEALADMLISLAGKKKLLIDEQRTRQEIFEHRRGLETDKEALRRQEQQDEITLKAISRMLEASATLDEAEADWNLYLAARIVADEHNSEVASDRAREAGEKLEATRQEIDVLKGQLEICQDTDELARRVRETSALLRTAEAKSTDLTRSLGGIEAECGLLRRRIAEITERADRGDAGALEQALAGRAEAHEAAVNARDAVRDAEANEKALRAAYEQEAEGQSGRAGEIVTALKRADLPATPLLDAISLADLLDHERHQWEARLSAHADTVIVRRADLQAVEKTLAAAQLLPGSSLLPMDQLSPPGVTLPLDHAFLAALEARVRAADGPHAVEDGPLGLRLYGGFEVPMTDRPARTAAARKRLEGAVGEREAAQRMEEQAKRDREDADAWEECCRTAALMIELRVKVAELNSQMDTMQADIEDAKAAETKARIRSTKAADAYKSAAQDIKSIKERIATAETKALAEKKEQHDQRAVVAGLTESLRLLGEALLGGATTAHALVNAQGKRPSTEAAFWAARDKIGTALDLAGCSRTRREEALTSDRVDDVSSDVSAQVRKGAEILLDWLKSVPDPGERARSFHDVCAPARRWIDFHSGGGEEELQAITARSERSRKALEASETSIAETIKWSEGNRETLIKNLQALFAEAENRLNSLLDSAGQSRVKLNVRHRAPTAPEDPLRWEVRPEWTKPGSDPIPYHGGDRNTAEYVILHAFLAASTLVAGGTPAGRMLIIDEAGNNLDTRNVGEVAKALRRIARDYGITVILAVQSQDINSLRPHCSTLINLSRYPGDILNAEPMVMSDLDVDLPAISGSIPREYMQ